MVCLKGWVLAGLGAVILWQLLVGAPIAHAHGGVDPGDNLWLAWNTGNPLPTLFLFAAAYLYVNGLGKWERAQPPGNGMAQDFLLFGLAGPFPGLAISH